MHALNPNTTERKGFIRYYKTYGITILKNHGDNDHTTIIEKFEKKVNVLVRGPFERQLAKKKDECFRECNI
jgi:hypothetical protein